jgi:hypothetical protein
MNAALQSVSCAHHFLPNLKGLSTQNPIVDRLHQVAAKTEEMLREPVA